jgi:hypothetical protein
MFEKISPAVVILALIVVLCLLSWVGKFSFSAHILPML